MLEHHDLLSQFVDDLLARPSGPFAFRFVLQPLMATYFGVRDGVADARAGRSPYMWLVFSDAHGRWARLKEGATHVGRVLGFSVVMDVAYQLIKLGELHPLETIVITLVLAFLPYLLIRGPANRIAKLWLDGRAARTAKK